MFVMCKARLWIFRFQPASNPLFPISVNDPSPTCLNKPTPPFLYTSTSIQSFSKSCQFILRSISHLFTSLYFQGHSPCPSHHYLKLERLQLTLYWSSLPSPAIILHPAAQVIFQNQNQILPCSYFELSVASHCSWHKIQIPHQGLQDPTGFVCCFLLFVSYPSFVCQILSLLVSLLFLTHAMFSH